MLSNVNGILKLVFLALVRSCVLVYSSPRLLKSCNQQRAHIHHRTT